MTDDLDAVVRLRAFDFLTEQRRRFAKRRSLARSSSVGIFKPAILPEVPHLHGIVQGIYEPAVASLHCRGPPRGPQLHRGD